MIYLGSDHRGFELKEELKKWLKSEEYEVEDVGAHIFDPDDDYVDFAIKVAEMVEGSAEDKGILICGSGHGAEMIANKFPGARAILGFNREVVVQGREHEDANILTLAADWIKASRAKEWISDFLTTETSQEERHKRRRARMAALRAR